MWMCVSTRSRRARLPHHAVIADGGEEVGLLGDPEGDDVGAAHDVAHVDLGAGDVRDDELAAVAAAVPGHELAVYAWA